MTKIYKSRVDLFFYATALAIVLSLFIPIPFIYRDILPLTILLVSGLFTVAILTDLYLHTDYRISDNKLYIRSGFLIQMKIPVEKITEIIHRGTWLSSPALSLKRIGLRYGRTNVVYISPDDMDGFIADLLSLNPGIKVK